MTGLPYISSPLARIFPASGSHTGRITNLPAMSSSRHLSCHACMDTCVYMPASRIFRNSRCFLSMGVSFARMIGLLRLSTCAWVSLTITSIRPDACVGDDLDATIVPQFDHPEVLLVRDRQRLPEMLQAPRVDPVPHHLDYTTILVGAYARRDDAHLLIVQQPPADALSHPWHGLADVVDPLPAVVVRQRPIQVDAVPALRLGLVRHRR